IDIVDAIAEISDELEPLAGLAEYGAVDVIGDRRHEHVGGFRRLHELRLAQRFVLGIEPRVEQFPHAHFDGVGQPPGNHDQGLFARRNALPLTRDGSNEDPKIQPCNGAFCNSRLRGLFANPAVQVSLTALAETTGRGAVLKISSRWPYSNKVR